MNKAGASIISKLNPAVPRHYLFGIAGILWTGAGLLLCVRATIWLEVFSFSTQVILGSVSVALAAAGYLLMFFKIVQKNIDRIGQLPERVCLFAFTAWRGYFIIVFMVTIGITLRNTSIPKYYLAVPYIAMGGILLIGSFSFYRRFAAARAG